MKNVADIYALSPMQKLMLLHAKTAGTVHDLLFNQIVYEIRGELDYAAYQRAWQLMIDRHPVLRTMFIWQDGKEPLQVVREKLDLPWSAHDWRNLNESEQLGQLEELLSSDRAEGFDMLRPPLMRLMLIRRDEQNHWLVWSSHHLVIDRWCIGKLFGEVKRAYEAYVGGLRPSLAPAPRYRDYIAWLAERDEQAAGAFWQESLRDLQALPLPLKPAQKESSPLVASAQFTLDAAAAASLRSFAIEHNLTLSTLVNGAWAILMSKMTGADDTLFGLTVSGRPAELPQIANAVGCFINNIPFHLTLEGDQLLPAWLAALQEQQLALQEYEFASPAQIQAWAGLKASGPLFDTLVVYQAPVPIPAPAGLEVRFLKGGMQTGYPLTLGVVPGEQQLGLSLTYDQTRLAAGQVSQIGHALQTLLLSFSQSPATSLNKLRAALPETLVNRTDQGEIEPIPIGHETYIPPRSAAEQALVQIWSELLDIPRVSIEDHFFDLGGDSVTALQLLSRVEEQLGVNVPITLIFNNPTVGDMAAKISGSAAGTPIDPILLPINQSGKQPPFFYAHGIFGDVSSLTNIVPLLPAGQPLYGLQAIGLHPEYEPDRTIEAMAAHYVAAIKRVQPDGPYRLGGFCFGGVLAFETARQLEQSGDQIALLAIIEGSAPREYHHSIPLYAPQRLEITRHSAPQIIRGNQEFGGWRLRERMQKVLGQRAPVGNGNGSQDEWDVEFDNLADYNATRPAVQHTLRDINVAAIEQYQPQPINGKITLFRARYLPPKHTLLARIDPRRGWGSLAQCGVTIRYVDGSHIGILRQPNASKLATALTQALEEAGKN